MNYVTVSVSWRPTPRAGGEEGGGGEGVKAVTSHQCGLGSNPGGRMVPVNSGFAPQAFSLKFISVQIKVIHRFDLELVALIIEPSCY